MTEVLFNRFLQRAAAAVSASSGRKELLVNVDIRTPESSPEQPPVLVTYTTLLELKTWLELEHHVVNNTWSVSSADPSQLRHDNITLTFESSDEAAAALPILNSDQDGDVVAESLPLSAVLSFITPNSVAILDNAMGAAAQNPRIVEYADVYSLYNWLRSTYRTFPAKADGVSPLGDSDIGKLKYAFLPGERVLYLIFTNERRADDMMDAFADLYALGQ